MVTSDLKLKPEGVEWSSLSQIQVIAERMSRQSLELQQFCNSRKFTELARNIISDYGELTKYIEDVKLADDRATKLHNSLYPKKS